jgi:SMC interacting uncharacterized protein involved in chromosome segregation
MQQVAQQHKDKTVVVNLNPEIADDIAVLKSENSRVMLNQALTDTQLWAEEQEIEGLQHRLSTELNSFKEAYQRTFNKINTEMDSLDPKLTSVEFLQNEKLQHADNHIDFDFLN